MAKTSPRIAIMLDLQWPYKRHSDIFAGTQRYAQSQGWTSIIDEFCHATLRNSRRKAPPFDGIIARANRLLAERAAETGIPLVNVWSSSPVFQLVPSVCPDPKEIGRLCAEHFMARGFRNFATVTSSSNRMETHAVAEFGRITANAEFTLAELLIPQNPQRDLASWRKTESLIRRSMDKWTPPVGVYIGQEAIGRVVVQMCENRGWRVPEDVAIIAGQNQETMCEYPRPSLTSVEVGYERIGYEAARWLHKLMDGEPAPGQPVLLAPQGLVVRESTDFFAVDNVLVASALSFISANSHRPIGPDEVATAVGAEVRTLQNYFRKFLGRPVAAEIRRVRIERAKRELAQGKRPLAEIARDVGFGDIQRLYEVFLREVGIAPSEYRRQRKLESRI
jgi:LacI family transcriptional regulator